ncbi:hypothetical protein ABXN37_20040 [Piscinibacter sakaiensis]|uniref:hypothetical protein n=1 Tax=Piscinibacter sakaiensis TaxID=1547922 RepID=UPI00372CE063
MQPASLPVGSISAPLERVVSPAPPTVPNCIACTVTPQRGVPSTWASERPVALSFSWAVNWAALSAVTWAGGLNTSAPRAFGSLPPPAVGVASSLPPQAANRAAAARAVNR